MQTIEEVVNKYAKDVKDVIARAVADVRTVQAQQLSTAFEKVARGFGAAPAELKPVIQRLRGSFAAAAPEQPKRSSATKPLAKLAAKRPAMSQKARILAQLTKVLKTPKQIAAGAQAPLQSVYSVLSEAKAKKQARCPKPGMYVKA